MRLNKGRPWVVAKWAQTRDGKMAMADGTRWISNERSREIVQQLRGRVDAILVGSGTVRADDPLLTARPTDAADVKRVALRVVVDSQASLPLESQLVRTARQCRCWWRFPAPRPTPRYDASTRPAFMSFIVQARCTANG